jgi:hypothetical protein
VTRVFPAANQRASPSGRVAQAARGISGYTARHLHKADYFY